MCDKWSPENAVVHILKVTLRNSTHFMQSQKRIGIVGSGPSSIFLAALLGGHVPSKTVSQFSKMYWPSKIVRKNPLINFVKKSSKFKVYILGDHLGGMWHEDDITETISYGWLIEIPQFPFDDYLRETDQMVEEYDFYRPTRSQIALYYQYVANSLDIEFIQCDVFKVDNENPFNIHTSNGTFIADKVIFATGKYTMPKRLSFDSDYTIPTNLPNRCLTKVLIVGSGFSAADAILQYLRWGVQVYHVFYALPEHKQVLKDCEHRHEIKYKQSPLVFCHSSSYPKYAEIYCAMKNSQIWRQLNNGKQLKDVKDKYIPLPGFDVVSETHLMDACGNVHEISVNYHHTLIGYHDLGWSVDGNTVYLRKSSEFLKHQLQKKLEIDNMYICGSADGATLICDCFESCYSIFNLINK